VREASGLPPIDTIRDPDRLAQIAAVVSGSGSSTVLAGLIHLAGRVAGADHAQLSLLADRQFATAVRASDASISEHVSPLEDSLCTVTVLSGDVLVAADTSMHPWLCDLPPVVEGAVGAYLGVPLLLPDGTSVGALCVYGPAPREWSHRDVGLTCDVADVVSLELRRLAVGSRAELSPAHPTPTS
jgi:GAF domain-containing protein